MIDPTKTNAIAIDYVFVVVLIVAFGCGGPKDVPEPYEHVEAIAIDFKACIHLRQLQCPEGSPKRGRCENAFAQARTLKEPDIDQVAPCISTCADVDCVRKCGGPGTLTFRCAIDDAGSR